ncbi:MAG: Na+:solute symporter [Elusimicrobia bacterium]|nr:Na+:solute symporter [Elusimicrobiota bacterium]
MTNNFMALSAIDWTIIAAYTGLSMLIGLYFSKRGSKNMAEYFVAGRDVTWWLAGISMVATTFAADTPLVVSAIVRTKGLQGNWYWWSSVMGAVMCIYFFARLWRRSGIITDAEFMEVRYHGKAGAFLRGFYAFFRSILCNSIVMGWVILAMSKIVYVLLGWPKTMSVWILVCISVVYILFSGLWGVLATDFFQFILAMSGCITFAAIVMVKAGGPAALIDKAVMACSAAAAADPQSNLVAPSQLMNLFPSFDSLNAGVIMFFAFVSLQWWQSAQGDGFLAQRLFSCKNEKHSLLSVLFYSFLHYAIRPWPWIIVGLGSLIFFPVLADPETAYPLMMIKFLPVGLKGVLVASFLAAFMSTLSTHINLGASYMVNDIYKRFFVPEASDKHYVAVSRISILVMTGLAGVASLLMHSVYSAWLLGTALMSGTALIVMLRWYWWRINAWSEISGIIAALAITLSLAASPTLGADKYYALRLFIIIFGTTAVSVITTFLTEPEPYDHLEKFYRRVRPSGWWGKLAERCPDVHPVKIGMAEFTDWGLTVVCIYSSLFGIGWLVLGRIKTGVISCLLCAVLLTVILKRINLMKWD